MRVLLASVAVGVCALSSAAHAQGVKTPGQLAVYQCAMALQSDDLFAVMTEATALSDAFKAAFNTLPMDKATTTISTVGATMVGHAMANEVGAAVDGLKNLVQLREHVRHPESQGMVLNQLNVAMRESSNRMRKLSIAYGKVSRMAYVKGVQDLATQGMAFSDRLSRQWVCEL